MDIVNNLSEADVNALKDNEAPKSPKIPQVDINFVSEQEGNKHKGYVPSQNSGVTIGMGFDLKDKDEDTLRRMGIEEKTIIKLKPFLGLSGDAAKAIAGNLMITDPEELNSLNQASKAFYIADIAKQYNKASGAKFVDLDPIQQTVLFSVGYQYGSLSRTPKFLKAAAENRWQDVHKELMNFGDDFKSRRQREARYLQQYLLRSKY